MRTEMTLMSEAVLVGRMRDIYRRRLQQILGEIKLRDESGNIIVSPGLKVRHAETGFEYTVDSVSEDPGTRQLSVTLKKPEVPRFDPPGEEFVGESGDLVKDKSDTLEMSHVDRLVSTFGDSTSGTQGESNITFVVNQQEFEEDYDLEMSDSDEKKKASNSSTSKSLNRNSQKSVKKSPKGAKK
jgi:hypothetical protein